MSESRPPDDTPTRLALKGVNHSDDQYHLKQLRAEVSRLREAADKWKAEFGEADRLADQMIIRAEAAEAEVSRLREENARLTKEKER